jgi:hypothetical protein
MLTAAYRATGTDGAGLLGLDGVEARAVRSFLTYRRDHFVGILQRNRQEFASITEWELKWSADLRKQLRH